MKDKQTKSAIVQWMIPTGVLLVAIIAMFIDFYITSSETAQSQIEKSFSTAAEGYATTMNERLVSVQKSGKVVAAIMEKHSNREIGIAEEMVEALYNKTDAYMVIMANMDGMGVNHNKDWVSITETDYYDLIKDGKERYLFLENDGINDKKAILNVLPINREESGVQEPRGMLLLYYPVEEFKTIVKNGEFDGNVFYCLFDETGKIYEHVEGYGTTLSSSNMWEIATDSTTKSIIKRRMENGTSGTSSGIDGGIQYKLVYAPVGINNWYVMLGIKQDYADFLQNKSWDNTRTMFIKLIVVICVFLAIIVILNIVGRLRSNRQNKDLADKADTDLLTDLNNKLATERKIKEYITEHPEEQALLFVLDIDNFKKINDTMGHAFGDEVLRTLGHQIRAEFRITDIIGRTGGDEFMIFLKNIKDDTLLKQEADRVANFFSHFQAGEYVKYSATASIGAAVFPRDAKDFESLYKAADKALYKAKERGKNQLAFYGDDK